ncbi:MAG: response regulator transcription factor [Acidimicrobiales bacterium]
MTANNGRLSRLQAAYRETPAPLDPSWKSIFDDLSEGVLVVDQAGHRVYSNGALNALVATNACFPQGTVDPPPYVPEDQRQRYLQALQGASSLLTLDGPGTTSTWLDLSIDGRPRVRTKVTISAFSGSRGRFAVWLFKPDAPPPYGPAWPAWSPDGALAPVGTPSLDVYLDRYATTVGSLTRREKDVLQLLLEGHRVVSIARRLHLSPQTVRNHLKGIFRKLGTHSQVELLEALRPAFHVPQIAQGKGLLPAQQAPL